MRKINKMHQPRIELGAQQSSVAARWGATWECWILPLNHWCNKPYENVEEYRYKYPS